jgi:acetoin utilization deacetylase AcuC-like enzyme
MAEPHAPFVPSLYLVDDVLFDEHRAPHPHPERPERVAAARRAASRATEAAGANTRRLEPRDATEDELARAHVAAYVEELATFAGKRMFVDADTFVAPGSVAAARRAAGGAMSLVDALLADTGPSPRGAALLRPPGHHATPERAMGFCLVNNVAVAAHHALARGLQRVAIVDFDVHHGNGTQDVFWEDPRVLFVSLHQAPLYPGTGHLGEVGGGEGRGATMNLPLPEGATDDVYRAAFDELVVPTLDAFEPELVLVSAGFDAHARDPLAAMQLGDGVYGDMLHALVGVAERSAGGRLGLLLEGGYDLDAVEASLAAALRAMLGGWERTARSVRPLDARFREPIEAARRLARLRFPGV